MATKAYTIRLTDMAHGHLDALNVYDRRRIVDEIKEQLVHEPAVPSRRRKVIDLPVPWDEQVGPVWQLRVGDFRVFYDVFDDAHKVIVRAIRHKGTLTTEEVLK